MTIVRSAPAAIAIWIAAVTAGCDSGAKVAPSSGASTTASVRPVSAPAIDPALVGTCVASYECGMSHPGLGSYSDARMVDLATCARTVTHDAGPYEEEVPPPGGAPSGDHTRKTEPLPPERCAEIAKLLAAITVADAAAAQESAQVDTQACTLDVNCPAGGPSKLRVQRQTTSGASTVELLIRTL